MRLIKGNVERVTESEEKAAKLKAAGYKEMDEKQEVLKEQQDTSVMSVAELRRLAKEKGVNGADSLKKEELLEILKDVV